MKILQNQSFSKTPFYEFNILLLITIGCILVFSIIAGGLSVLFIGAESGNFLSDGNSSHVVFLKTLDMVLRIGIMGMPAFIGTMVLKLNPISFLNISKSPNGRDIGFFLLLFIMMFPFLEWLIGFNLQMSFPESLARVEDWMRNKEEASANLLTQFLEVETFKGMLFNLVIIALMPALLEELFFRGFLQNFLIRWFNKTHLAVFVSAFVFSAIHMQFFGFLPRFILGLILGYMLVWTKSLWTPIIFHFINNAFTVIFVYLANNGYINAQVNDPINMNNIITILSFALAGAFFILLAMYYQKRKDSSKDWVKIYNAGSNSEAEIIKGKLQIEDINAVSINKKVSLFPSFGSVDILVAPEDVDKAKGIISNINLEITDK